jgi:hypothetical protein
MPNGDTPNFSQIADAMSKINDQLNATPPPSVSLKQSLTDTYQTLRSALGGIVLGDGASASASVADAAKQLQDIVNSGAADPDIIQQILGSLGFQQQPAEPAQAQPPAKPLAAAVAGPVGTPGGSTAAPAFSDRVPIPPVTQMNVGLTACSEATMLKKFGKPGSLTKDCSPATGPFLKRVRKSFDVGPFKVTGLDYAVESLLQIFNDVKKDNQALYDQVKNEGMLCVRARRHSANHYSNHSWGTAIDIFFGTAVVDQSVRLAHRGNLLLAPYFNRHGWYWGAGFSGDSVDSMHFELAEETIPKIPDRVMFDDVVESADIVGGAPMATIAGGYQTDPASKRLLADIMPAIEKAKPVKQRFAGVTFAATLEAGQLVFQSELQLDTDGWPKAKDEGDPDAQLTTSLQYLDKSFVNANEVPYFVLPGGWYAQFGIKVGDLAAVVYKGKLAYAVFADVGPKTKLGEGSLELLRQLGEERLRPNGRVINSGTSGGVTTIVFPRSAAAPYQNQATLLKFIQTRGPILFMQIGGLLPDELPDA